MPREIPAYDEVQLRLTPGPDGVYNCTISAPGGRSQAGTFALPFSDAEVENFRLKVDPSRARVRGAGLASPQLKLAREFGTQLYSALVEDAAIRDLLVSSRRRAEDEQRALRLTLSLSGAPDLMQVPWEFLYAERSFLAQSIWSPVVRYMDIENRVRPLKVDLPLRILGMVSAPNEPTLAPLDTEREMRQLEDALAGLIESGSVELRWLAGSTMRDLQREVAHGEDFHVFHFIGHGTCEDGEGYLVLTDEHGAAEYVSGDRLGQMLTDRRTLRLAVLNACEAAATAPTDPLAGVATGLVAKAVPAVIGMQFAITDAAAITFAEEFYAALARGFPVDMATTEARRAISAEDNVQWATPVLFMRVADGRLFDLPDAPEPDLARTASRPAPDHAADASEPTDPATDKPAGAAHAPEPTSEDAPERIEQQASPTDSARDADAEPEATEGADTAAPTPARATAPPSRAGAAADEEGHDDQVAGIVDDDRELAPDWSVEPQLRFKVTHESAGDRSVSRFRLAFSPDSSMLASISPDGTTRIWELPIGHERGSVQHGDTPLKKADVACAFSPQSGFLATSGNGIVRAWSIDPLPSSERRTHSFQLESPGVKAIAYDPAGRWLATAGDDGSARLWDRRFENVRLRLQHEDAIGRVSFTPDGRSVVTAGEDHVIQVNGLPEGRRRFNLTPASLRSTLAISADGRLIASVNEAGRIGIWSLEDGTLVQTIKRWSFTAKALSLTPDGRFVAGIDGGKMIVWEVESGAIVYQLKHGFGRMLRDISFSPDGRFLATGDDLKEVRVWETPGRS